MNTLDFEVHRAIVHYSDPFTGEAQVRIPTLLGSGQVVNVPTTGLTFVNNVWNVPVTGSSVFVAVSGDRTQFLWVIGPPSPYPETTPYTVGGGTTGTQPTFSGDPLFTAQYVRVGDLVHFEVQVDFDNITSFGTGQYFVTLPFPVAQGIMFRNGCLHDISTGREYHISGHAYPGSSDLMLFTTDIVGQNVYDFPFEQGEPVTLSTADNFHISGDYIAEPLA
jgi:hypothetical protein